MATTPRRSGLRIALEVGSRWTFATALDWPGWCRRGRGDDAAVEELLAYHGRYAAAVSEEPDTRQLVIVGSVPGDSTTDFGAPAAQGPWDLDDLTDVELDRQLRLLERCWQHFDAVVAGSPEVLVKGPRGGGRDRDAIGDHVREAERSYCSKAGARVPPRTPWPEQRDRLVEALRSRTDAAWPPRLAIRRSAWHVLDHAWEIEDRAAP